MVTTGNVAARIRHSFPHVRATRVDVLPHLGWGGDSDAYLVDGTHVFRFPRTPEIARALEVEICFLPQLAPRVGLPIPQFEYVARDPDTGQLQFVGYRCLPGDSLTPETFAAIERDVDLVDRFARQIGAFLTGLHTTPLEVARACGVPDPAGTRRQQVEQQFARVRQRVYPVLEDAEQHYLDGVFQALLQDDDHFSWPHTVCHGDLSADHILITGTLDIGGIIDFGDLCIGDPAGDFVWTARYGEDLLRRILGHYRGPVEDHTALARVAALRFATVPTIEIAYGLETENAAYVEEGKAALRSLARR